MIIAMDSTDEEVTVGRSRGKEIALNVAAVAGLICIIATLASLIFGIKPLVFRSGSMEPAISTGALALAKTVPATELAVGDVISVRFRESDGASDRPAELGRHRSPGFCSASPGRSSCGLPTENSWQRFSSSACDSVPLPARNSSAMAR